MVLVHFLMLPDREITYLCCPGEASRREVICYMRPPLGDTRLLLSKCGELLTSTVQGVSCVDKCCYHEGNAKKFNVRRRVVRRNRT